MTPTIELHAAPTPLHTAPKPPRLDRAKWHKPLISIVVTHFNYSHHVRDALLSIVDQSYENWECVVVDDCSTSHHRVTLAEIIHEIGCDKIRLLCLDRNEGQIPAFFHGLDATTGDFVCLLDPDDRWHEQFLEKVLATHLNDEIYCPIVCTDQQLLTQHGLLTGIYTHRNRNRNRNRAFSYIERWTRGWHWTSTSAMMFRRAALKFMRPAKRLDYKRCADSYLAQGAHILGGTIFLHDPLVYRQLHTENSWVRNDIFWIDQNKANADAPQDERTAECLVDVRQAIDDNGGNNLLLKASTQAKEKGTVARLRRSFNKRADRLALLIWKKASQ